MSNDKLGDRMKNFEDAYRLHLPIRMPVIIRVDGKSFHSYTKGCKKPIDQGLVDCMNETAKTLCETIQGSKLAYVQSDEISILVTNYDTIDTQSWFDNNLQKIVSVSAAVASTTFTMNSDKIWGVGALSGIPHYKSAYFDSRAFVLPKEEVCNMFIWRQQDCIRNSVQMMARSLYSHKQCENKNAQQLKTMIAEKGMGLWEQIPLSQQQGRCLIKRQYPFIGVNPKTGEELPATRSVWEVQSAPLFTQDRGFIDNLVNNVEATHA